MVNAYQELYNIIQQYIYGGGDITWFQELTCTLCATVGAIITLAIPFYVAYKIIDCIVDRW